MGAKRFPYVIPTYPSSSQTLLEFYQNALPVDICVFLLKNYQVNRLEKKWFHVQDPVPLQEEEKGVWVDHIKVILRGVTVLHGNYNESWNLRDYLMDQRRIFWDVTTFGNHQWVRGGRKRINGCQWLGRREIFVVNIEDEIKVKVCFIIKKRNFFRCSWTEGAKACLLATTGWLQKCTFLSGLINHLTLIRRNTN